ncbi:hypothetical protein I5Q34_05730 [Streptomyces sp. AV19]|uniref:hypothetical protein n=1 Tax=Streptomyces sp. AV19 TaxID=2793068 RepID=UPI0018FE7FB8|nr:hypothetical protein [Streptomyces sp. AV19]MBH1933801.1 hypothetical protein [Streptomyces sp. AV19]MDG4535694.1 hypothetical protein [Streptomyces sp. AV19]
MTDRDDGVVARRPDAERLSYRAFRLGRRADYLRFARARLGSEAAAAEAVERAFDVIRDNWPALLRMAQLERCAWTLLVRHVRDLAVLEPAVREQPPAREQLAAREPAVQEQARREPAVRGRDARDGRDAAPRDRPAPTPRGDAP